jgi:ribosomal protein L7/L12
MTDIVVLSLPEADREMLKEGIRVDGAEALREMLEDFGS